ncbi:MULE transposase [Hirsutella rhossiliensis]
MEAVYALQFESHEDAIAACHAAARAEGFALAVRTKKPSAANPQWILLRCSKGRHWQDQGDEGAHESKRRRKTSTQKTNCEFRVIVRKANGSASKSTHPGGWVVAPSSLGEAHNHEFTPAITHSRYRAEVIQRHHEHITHLYNCGLRPFLIASHLRGLSHEDPDLAGITGQHVRNAIASYRLQELTGRTPIQFLYDQLNTSDFFFRDTRDQEGRLTGLFISPRSGIELWRQYANILLLDCTYKTNRFNMPLLNVCGSTAERKTFSVASIFLNGEAEPQYRWALQCLLELAAEEGIPMPRVIVTDRDLALMNALVSCPELEHVIHLLCRWHVNKNVLTKSTISDYGNLLLRAVTHRQQWIMRTYDDLYRGGPAFYNEAVPLVLNG